MKKLITLLSLLVLTLIYFGCRKDEDPVPVIDTTPPTSVENVMGELVLNKDKTVIDTLKVNWDASTDAGSAVKYDVNLLMYDENGVPKKIRSVETDTPSAFFIALSNSKTYKVEVQAKDLSNNKATNVLKDLSERSPFELVIGTDEVTFSWTDVKEENDKVSSLVTITKFANGSENAQDIVVSETIEASTYTFKEYDKLYNYIIKVVSTNQNKQTVETREHKLVSENTTEDVQELSFNKVINPDNLKIIDALKLSWLHNASSSVESTEFVVDLYMYDTDNLNPKKIRTVTTNNKSCEFTTIDNTRTYHVIVTAQNKAKTNPAISGAVLLMVDGIESTVTSAVKNIIYNKEIDPTNANLIKSLNLSWEHTAQSSLALMEYTIDFYYYDDQGKAVFIEQIKTRNKNYAFTNLDNKKAYRVSIIASNISKEEVYTPAPGVVIRVEVDNLDTTKTNPIRNIQFTKELDPNNVKIINTLSFNWEHDPKANASTQYTINLLMFDDNGDNPKQIRTETTTAKTVQFTLLNNTKKYRVDVSATSTVNGTALKPSEVASSIVEGVSFTQTTPVKRISFVKELATGNNDVIKNLLVTWDRDVQDSNEDVEFTIQLLDGTSVKETIKTKNKNVSFRDVKNTDYRVTIIASNLTTDKVFTPSITKEVTIERQQFTSEDIVLKPEISNIKAEKVLDPSNVKIINNLKISWEHATSDIISSSEYEVQLYMYDDNDVLKNIRTIKTNDKSCSFETLSNTRTYMVKIIATNQSQHLNETTTSEGQLQIVGISSKQTTAIKNLTYDIVLSKTDANKIESLTFKWEHTPTSSNPVMQYTLDFYQYNSEGTPVKLETIKADNKTYTFKNLDRLKDYRISVIASDINKTEIYTPSDAVVIKVSAPTDDATKTNPVKNIVVKKTLNETDKRLIDKLEISWEHDTADYVTSTEYTVSLFKIEDDGKETIVKTQKTTEKSVSYTSLSNDYNYTFRISATNAIGEVKNLVSEEASTTIEGVKPLRTNAVYDLTVTKNVNPDNTLSYKSLVVDWKHEAQTSNVLIEYKISLYELDNQDNPTLLKEYNTFKTNYSYFNVSTEKAYKVKVVASIIDHPTETFLDSNPVEKKVAIEYKTITNFNYKKYNGLLIMNWDANTQTPNPRYKIELWEYHYSYTYTMCQCDEGGNRFSKKETVTTESNSYTFDDISKYAVTPYYSSWGETGSSYFYVKIIVVDSDNNSGLEYKSKTLNNTFPATVTDVSSDLNGSNITLKWTNNEPSTSFKEFEIELVKSGNAAYGYKVTTSQNTYTFNNLNSGKYKFIIYTLNKEGYKSAKTEFSTEIFPIGTYPGDVYIRTQSEANRFKEHQLHTIDGSVNIQDQSIDISMFKGIKTITGSLNIRGNFEHATTSSPSAFSELETVGGNLLIDAPKYNTDLSEFNSLTSAKTVTIKNSSIAQTTGFTSLQTTDAVTIYNNDKMSNTPSFNKIKSLSKLEIAKNDNLKTIQGFNDLLGITTFLKIYENKSLETISGFDKLRFVTTDLNINNNNYTSNMSVTGFGALEEVDNLKIANNYLSKIPTFSNLRTVFVSLSIENNKGSFSLNQNFPSLTEVKNKILIKNNTNLTSIVDFKSLIQTQAIEISGNNELSTLSIESADKDNLLIRTANNPKLVN